MKIALYGLFDDQDRCRYVGATQNPKARASNLRVLLSAEGKTNYRMAVLRWTSPAGAWQIEPQIIAAYWRRGLADWNKTLAPRRYLRRKNESESVAAYNKFINSVLREKYLSNLGAKFGIRPQIKCDSFVAP